MTDVLHCFRLRVQDAIPRADHNGRQTASCLPRQSCWQLSATVVGIYTDIARPAQWPTGSLPKAELLFTRDPPPEVDFCRLIFATAALSVYTSCLCWPRLAICL